MGERLTSHIQQTPERLDPAHVNNLDKAIANAEQLTAEIVELLRNPACRRAGRQAEGGVGPQDRPTPLEA